MKQTGTDVNRMVLHGRVAQPPALSHCNHEVEFFTFPLAVSRLSGVADQVNVVAARALRAFAEIENSRPYEKGGFINDSGDR